MGVSVSLNDPVNNSLPVNKTAAGNDLGAQNSQDLQNSFLTLLVAQLRNQDPTNPLDNSQLTSQLAQISTVSGIEKLNTTLGAISGQIDHSQSLQASSLIGRGVMIPGSTILLGRETPPEATLQVSDGEGGAITTTPFGLELDGGAESVIVTIQDASGNAVKKIDLGSVPAGVHSFTWDGKAESGEGAPDGAYTFTINATNEGVPVVAQPLTFGMVFGVTKNGKTPMLELGTAGTVTLDEVRQIL
ncbi:flagellar hook assembly protein FlgD [Enterobacillus tribolii]|uniref:Basal-body rod modification protein FlgD n=1 Tax=Enterobacillus tribolii TaxID=1487935 RepID=A0A370R2V2_9GAMM|nr:flagellar hook assembly protein FlgD [Enterobacillus tribolii]MBW7984771.1 flagellar hook assembly protein FlgD [Enterobacillus tribolii]RDK96772.1 flagellar basal-body rod modification protein FlgD [Enterobacillus tribolii]